MLGIPAAAPVNARDNPWEPVRELLTRPSAIPSVIIHLRETRPAETAPRASGALIQRITRNRLPVAAVAICALGLFGLRAWFSLTEIQPVAQVASEDANPQKYPIGSSLADIPRGELKAFFGDLGPARTLAVLETRTVVSESDSHVADFKSILAEVRRRYPDVDDSMIVARTIQFAGLIRKEGFSIEPRYFLEQMIEAQPAESSPTLRKSEFPKMCALVATYYEAIEKDKREPSSDGISRTFSSPAQFVIALRRVLDPGLANPE